MLRLRSLLTLRAWSTKGYWVVSQFGSEKLMERYCVEPSPRLPVR